MSCSSEPPLGVLVDELFLYSGRAAWRMTGRCAGTSGGACAGLLSEGWRMQVRAGALSDCVDTGPDLHHGASGGLQPSRSSEGHRCGCNMQVMIRILLVRDCGGCTPRYRRSPMVRPDTEDISW